MIGLRMHVESGSPRSSGRRHRNGSDSVGAVITGVCYRTGTWLMVPWPRIRPVGVGSPSERLVDVPQKRLEYTGVIRLTGGVCDQIFPMNVSLIIELRLDSLGTVNSSWRCGGAVRELKRDWRCRFFGIAISRVNGVAISTHKCQGIRPLVPGFFHANR